LKLGNISWEGGKYDRAAELYQYVIDNWPKTEHEMRAKTGIAKLNISLGNDAAVEATIDSLIADFNDHPTLPQAIFSIAEKYFYNGNYRQAIDLWQLVRTDYPDCPLNHEIPYLLATCYERLKDYAEAAEYYTIVVEQYPDSPYAYRAPYRLGIMYRRLRDYGQAVYWFEQQRKLYSDESLSERALFFQGIVYLFNMDEYQKSSEIFQEYAQLYPETENAPLALSNLAMCHEKMGDKTQAITLLENALLLYPGNIFAKDITDKLVELQEEK